MSSRLTWGSEILCARQESKILRQDIDMLEQWIRGIYHFLTLGATLGTTQLGSGNGLTGGVEDPSHQSSES